MSRSERLLRQVARIASGTLIAAAVLTGCHASGTPRLSKSTAPLAAGDFASAEMWSAPIADYLAVGEANFPDGFTRSITALAVSDPDGDGPRESLLWIGYGDATRNLGTKTPIEFRYFVASEDPGFRVARVLAAPPVTASQQGAPQRTPSDTGEEQIEPYRVIGGTLWQAGVDSNDPDELWTQAKPAPFKPIEGNVFRLEDRWGQPAWRKFRSIPGGEHVHDICEFDGAIWAVGSGSAHRGEWESGEIFRYLWRSDDGGETFVPALRAMFPEKGKGDTRFRRLLPVGESLYVFGYVNPFVDGGPIEGRHVMLRDEAFTELAIDRDGPIADLLVLRTWPLDATTGLALARNPDRSTRMFLVEPGSIRELESWSDLSVIDVASTGAPGEFVLVAGDRNDPQRFAAYSLSLADAKSMRMPTRVLDLPGVVPSAVAMWRGDLYVGTEGGQVLRSERADR
ncbi:MAG: hypothetical protein ACO3EP_09065 [Phycisphaerales bacterium]